MLIHIIGRDNAAGLSEDIKILTDIFSEQGWTVHFSDYKSLKRFRFWRTRQYDVNIFLQWANPTWMKLAKKNILIPNPEWFKIKWMDTIPLFDAVFCKTRIAEEIFQARNPRTFFTSFTSTDRRISDILKKKNEWLHLAGKSKLKGTDTLVDTWLKNPNFPRLTIVQRNPEKPLPKARNIKYITEFLDAGHLRKLMNQCPVHLCPSATEGFGHTMGEALSCGALVVTTDAPPMNELVTRERGFLIPPVSHRKMKLATARFVDEQGIENTVHRVLSSDRHEQMMRCARDFFLSNDRFFKHEIISRIMEVKSSGTIS